MKFSEVKLPSNRKFGIFFSGIFFVLSIYFLYLESYLLASIFFIISLLFIVISIFKADLLLPLNRFGCEWNYPWKDNQSIIMADIFLMITLSIVMRIMGRDEQIEKISNLLDFFIFKVYLKLILRSNFVDK